ncbi:MAG: Ldh family oxidoreductase [Candidatus Handelsmanbacteria bacterium]|nr:Ldh family oxidoreductase [Candidatus Handelsmanbacteria bacterium]
MNQPPETYILIREERLLTFVRACFEQVRLEADHAALIARLLVNANLRGGSAFAQGQLNPRPQVRPVYENSTTAVLHGDGTLGYLPMVRAAEEAVARTKRVGIGHYGSAGYYARLCLEQGCIGFSLQGWRGEGNAHKCETNPSVAFSGNPPLCFAMPAGQESAVVLDTGTNVFGTYNYPEFEDLKARIPAAFFKSIGYIALATLVGGALTGYTLPRGDEIEDRWGAARVGGMVLAVDVAGAADPGGFAAEADRYIRETHQPMLGTDQALLPGAVEEQLMAQYRREGIHFGESEQEAARAAHQQFGVRLPRD